MKNVSELFKKLVTNSQSGIGMLQGIMMTAAVGGAIYTVTMISTSSKKSQDSVKKMSDVSDLNINLVSNVKNLFVDTVNNKGMKTGGICEHVRTDARDSVLANVYMLLPNIDEQLFLDERWEKYFPGYQIVENSKCDNYIYGGKDVPDAHYRRCFKIDITSEIFGVGLSKSLSKRYDPYIEVKIQPVFTNPIESNPFIAFKPNQAGELKSVEEGENGDPIKYDVKSIGFQYVITSNYITSSKQTQDAETGEVQFQHRRKSRSLEGFTWSGEAGLCDIVDKNGDIKEVALTATGPGTTNNDIILNYAGFTEDSKATNGQEPLEVVMQSNEVQSGLLVSNANGGSAQTITSDTESLVYASCNERVFRCRQLQENDDKREYDSITLPMTINYIRPNKVTSSGGEVSYSPSISFRRTSGQIEIVDVDYKDSISSSKKLYKYGLDVDRKSYQLFENGRFYNVLYKPVLKAVALDLVNISVSDIRNRLQNNVIPQMNSARIRNLVALPFTRGANRVDVDSRVLRANESPSANEELIEVGGRRFAISYQKRVKTLLTELKASSTHQLTYELMDKIAEETNPTANATCRKICNAGNQYNKGSDPILPYFGYKINIENTLNADGEEIQTDYMKAQAPVACTSCYMKSCERIGLGTFGSMKEMPSEPTDAGIPECVQYEGVAKAKVEKNDINLGSDKANKCIAMKLKSGDMAGYEYVAEDCFAEHNVLCFNYGKHQLAEDVGPNGSTLVKAQYNSARNVCFNTSKEIVSTDSLTALFDQQGFDIDGENPDTVTPANLAFANAAKEFMAIGTVTTLDILSALRVFRTGTLPPGTSRTLQGSVRRLITRPVPQGRNISSTIERAEIGFFNLANQGSFFAPVGGNQEEALREYNKGKNQISSQKFWVGLQTDNLGYIYSPTPTVPDQAENDENVWSLSFNENATLIAKKHDVELDLKTGSGKQVGLLYHHVRYKGVKFANEDAPIVEVTGSGADEVTTEIALRFLCRKNDGEMIVTSGDAGKSTKISDGYQICKDNGANFLPPTSTGQWEHSFQLAHSNSRNASYPDRAIASAKDYAPVWVAVEKGVSIGVYGSLGASNFFEGDSSWRMKKNGAFVAEDADKENLVKICLNESSGEFSQQNSCNGGGRRFMTEDELNAINDEKNIILKSNFLAALDKVSDSDAQIQVLEEPSDD